MTNFKNTTHTKFKICKKKKKDKIPDLTGCIWYYAWKHSRYKNISISTVCHTIYEECWNEYYDHING